MRAADIPGPVPSTSRRPDPRDVYKARNRTLLMYTTATVSLDPASLTLTNYKPT
jgi:hypothetical protein